MLQKQLSDAMPLPFIIDGKSQPTQTEAEPTLVGRRRGITLGSEAAIGSQVHLPATKYNNASVHFN